MSSPITRDIRYKCGPKTSAKCAEYFAAMALPIPNRNDVFSTSDNGYLIFLKRYGVTLRLISDKDYPLIDHPDILQPVASRMLKRLRADIYPGIYPTVSKACSNRLRRKLMLSGVRYWDDQRENGGYLPKLDGSGPGDQAVVLDAGACAIPHRLIYTAIAHLQNALTFVKRTPDIESPQDQRYKSLRDAFNNAWPAGMDRPYPEKITLFWELCRQKKDKGILVSAWDRNAPAIHQAASSYENRLPGSMPHAKLLRRKAQPHDEISLV